MIEEGEVRVPLRRGRKPLADGEFSAAALDTRRRILEAGRRLVEEEATWPSPNAIHTFDPSLSIGNIGHHVDVVNEARRIWCAAYGPHPHWHDPLTVSDDDPAGIDAGSEEGLLAAGGGADDYRASQAMPGLAEELDLERLRTRRLDRELKEAGQEIARLKLVVANLKEINERLMRGLREPLATHPDDGGRPPV